MNASEPYKLSTPYLKQGNSSSRRYSETSPKSKMLENLSHARKLIKTQKDALLEIQNTLRLLGREQHSSLKSCGSNSDRIYLHALREISQRKHSHFNIFGYGHEPPIRIHLSKSARKFTHEIRIVPLLAIPSFLGILNSGWSFDHTSECTINECQRSILQLSLSVDKDLEEIDELFDSINLDSLGISLRLSQASSSCDESCLGSKPSLPRAIFAWVNSLRILFSGKLSPARPYS